MSKITQGALPLGLPPAARLLRGPGDQTLPVFEVTETAFDVGFLCICISCSVPGEGPEPHRASHHVPPQV